MTTICFYQDSRHDKTLEWIRDLFDIGYLSKRNDGMSELRINGHKQVLAILKSLLPHIKFKKIQTKALAEACNILNSGTIKTLNNRQLKNLVSLMVVIQKENYSTKSKKTEEELLAILGLTP